MPVDYAISLMRLRPNGGKAAAELRQNARPFELFFIKLKYLHVIRANLSVLRKRCDELAAKWGHAVLRLKPHAAASGFLRGGRMASDRFVVVADAMKLRKKFRREAARR
jgi:hypothetical protein